ncbi:ADP-ribose glycohydrolase OARD1 [Frankliniella fusca]|uniref:ADP-ribose glycohydrolase OARD1 n=1 Tax=Frankliniella fusca TaxID=407009 RepID=A0AAE1I541_9NEOP|nr:ADP-ribose glycohydrolase OARD1 [Frankliniella fusca]
MAPVRGEKVQQVMCDLFSAPDDHALAHCVGADLRMGKGIAVDFRVRYGHVDFLKLQGKVPGEVAVLPAEMCGRAAPIFYLVSKNISTAYGPRWEDFCCLQELRKLCEEMGVKKVAMPRIGCFNDHLSLPKVEEELYSTFQSSPVSVLVFSPPNPVVGHPYPLVLPPQPSFMGWQVLGDSNMVRFCVRFGLYSQSPLERFPKQLGLCISGQRMKSLHFLISAGAQLHDNVIVMIGTNDILQIFRLSQYRTDIKQTLRATFFQLCKILSSRCRRVLFVTLPPIPAHAECEEDVHWLNALILKAANHRSNFQVLNTYPLFLTANNVIDTSRFEQWMGPPGNVRPDGIHLNHQGLSLLKLKLEDHIS